MNRVFTRSLLICAWLGAVAATAARAQSVGYYRSDAIFSHLDAVAGATNAMERWRGKI